MSRGTILFLDDDKDLQSLVGACLRSRGYEVESALDVKKARTILAGIRVDAAIVDGLLPGMTGTDFIQELRLQYPTLPILFASSFWKDMKSHDQLIRELKVSRVMHKPYKPQDILGWVEQVLAARAPPAPTQGTSADDDLDAAFQALRVRYGAGLGDKLRELTATMERAQAGSAEALDAAYQLAHKLAGTAGSYGFGPVSTAARTLEVELKRTVDGKAAADWKALEAARLALATEVTRSTPKP